MRIDLLNKEELKITEEKIRPPFGYYGAKHRIAQKIIEILPPHNAWVEAFCGSASITLAKAPAQIEIINDLDNEIVNLFEQLRNNTQELCRLISFTPYARNEFRDSRIEKAGLNDIERARRFLVATMMTVNGSIGGPNAGFSFSNSYSRSNTEARVNRWYNLPERLEKVAERLRRVRIENIDARELLVSFLNRPATLVYLDPPYLTERSHQYRIDANDEHFHNELIDLCIRADSMILISGYENELYKKRLKKANGWEYLKIETKTRGTSGLDKDRTEILWYNEQFKRASIKKRTNIRLSKKESLGNKVNPKRTKK